MMSEALVRTHRLHKSFSSVPVLTDVSFEVRPGEILGIIGENGAGKSTLMKILSGIYAPTSGEIFFEGRRVDIRTPAEARGVGISLIPQEFNLVNSLTVYDNIFLGAELLRGGGLFGRGRLLDKRLMKRRTRELLRELGVNISPEQAIDGLSAAQKQMVEICKALAFKARLLIMDEPTSVLTRHEVELLFRLMRRLQGQGITMIYISHKLKEVKEICDRVLVLRDGRFVAEQPVAETGIQQMAERMVGREFSQVFPEKTAPAEEVVLSVRGLTVPGVLEGVSFDLRRGEILGFAGLVGAGRTETAEAIMGLRRPSGGEVLLEGRRLRIRHPREAVSAGVNYLSEDRQGSGILTAFSITHNTTLVSLREYSRAPFGLIDKRRETEAAAGYRRLFNIKADSLDTRLEFLSGGNQQKVSLAKSIDPRPRVLIVDEPTRGIDVSAKQEIYRLIHRLAGQGISFLFISSELEEIIGMAHRAVVMREGRVTGILESRQMSEERIVFLATGVRVEG